MFGNKSNYSFAAISPYGTRLLLTSASRSPMTLLSDHFLAEGVSKEEQQDYLESFFSSKSMRFLNAGLACYPQSQFFHCHTIDTPAKAKSEEYFFDKIHTEFQRDTSLDRVAVLNRLNGNAFDFEIGAARQREVLLCGARSDDLLSIQNEAIDVGLFPKSLELGCLSGVSGLRDYLSYRQIEEPVLVLYVGLASSYLFIVNSKGIEFARSVEQGFNGMVQTLRSQLGLQDEQSALRLLFSETFDVADLGVSLVDAILKEVQSATEFYELQTGQSIAKLFIPSLAIHLDWVSRFLAENLQLDVLDIDYSTWLEAKGITLGSSFNKDSLNSSMHDVFSLLLDLAQEGSDAS